MSQQPNIFITTLAQSLAVGGSESEIYVSSITTQDGQTISTADFAQWGRGVLTIDPQSSSRAEFASFTAVDGSGIGFTGITRGLSFKDNTSITANKKYHPVGSTVIISFGTHNIQDMVDKFADIGSAEINISGLWTYTTSPVAPVPTTSTQVATKGYVDGVAVAGAPNGSTTVKGIFQEATQAQILSKTATGSTGADLAVNPSTLASTLLSDYKADTGTANTYAIAPSPAITAYTAGQIFSFKATNANTTTSTLNVNALGAKTIKKAGGATDLASGDIAAGMVVLVEYDGTNFIMLNPVSNNPLTQSGFFFGDGSDGDITVNSGSFTSGPITSNALTRDAYFNNLTINDTFTLNPAGYRIFVKGTLTLVNTGTIARNGNNAPNSGNVTGGGGGAALADGTIKGSVAGGNGGQSALAVGNNGNSTTQSIGTLTAAGNGGASNNGGGAGGTGVVSTAASILPTKPAYPISLQAINLWISTAGTPTPTYYNASGSGAGGGASTSNGGVCYGAGGGSAGGIIFIAASSIVSPANNCIQVKGGNGGNATFTNSTPSTGGGGGGGNGGVIVLVYSTFSGTALTAAAAATGGTFGTGGGSGTAGANGIIYTFTV